jgi:hypothetical protein
MPVLAFFAAAGLALLALLYVAEATLEKGVTPIVTSSRVGLPESKNVLKLSTFSLRQPRLSPI